MSKKYFEPTAEMNELLTRAGSMNREESLGATRELAKALEIPLRKGVMSGDILDVFLKPFVWLPVPPLSSRWIS